MLAQVRAVQADYDRRSPLWRSLYDGEPASFHDHVLQDRLRIALRFVERYGAATGRSLDVGCGAGQLVAACRARGLDAHGADVSREQVRSAAGRAAGRVVQADGLSVPFASESFAVVTGLGYLEYLPDPAAGLAELARVVAPGGLVVVSMPNALRLPYLVDPVRVVQGRRRPAHQGYPRRYTSRSRLRRLLTTAGLLPVAAVGHGHGPFTLAGRPLLSDSASVALDRRLPALLGPLGADLVMAAVRPPAPRAPDSGAQAAGASPAAAVAGPRSP